MTVPASADGVPVTDARFSLHKLRVFREVAERQSVTDAAKALFVTQPVVSGHIRDIEAFFGAELFTRSGQRMVLTDAGRVVLDYATSVGQSTLEAYNNVRLLANGEAGCIGIGTSETPGSYCLPRWVASFTSDRPGVEISMDVLGVKDACKQTKEGRYDIGIVAALEVPMGLHSEVLYYESLVMLCSRDHPLVRRGRRRGPFDPGEVASHGFIGHSDRPEDWLPHRLELFGVHNPKVVMRVGNAEAMKEALHASRGLAVLYRCSVERELESGEFVEVPVVSPSPRRPVYLIHAAGRSLTPLQQRLVAHLRREAESHTGGTAARATG